MFSSVIYTDSLITGWDKKFIHLILGKAKNLSSCKLRYPDLEEKSAKS